MSGRIVLPYDGELTLVELKARGFEWEGIQFKHDSLNMFVTDSRYSFSIDIQIYPLNNDSIKCWTCIKHSGLKYEHSTRFPEYNLDTAVRAAIATSWHCMMSAIDVMRAADRNLKSNVFKENPLKEQA
jgi:hypothetical protein